MRFPHPLLLSLLAAVCITAPRAQTFETGQTYWGANHYVEYIAGNAPIVLSAGHGGYLKPSAIPNRTYGVSGQDRKTQELARVVAEEIVARTGRHPHLIISHLHRSKLDPNREIVEAAQGDPIAEQAWHDFHSFLVTATSTVRSRWGKGHYVDLHGHGHPNNWNELGYALTSSELALSNNQLNSPTYINKSTLRAIGNTAGVSFPEVLRGATSMGGLLATAGWTCVPSPAIPDPGNNAYFSGGYNVRLHSSRVNGTVDATQIELPNSIRDDPAQRRAFARSLAAALSTFSITYYGIDPAADPRVSVSASDDTASESGDPGAFTFTRSGNLQNAMALTFVVGGRATEGTDYSALGTTITIPAQQTSVTLPVLPLGDGLAEGSEVVSVQLVGGIEIGAPASATVVILDDDGDPHLQAHWALDESAGTTATDSSAFARHGTLEPSAATGPQWRTGRHLGGLDFDELDDRVRVPNFGYARNGDFTLWFWFKLPPSAQSSYQYAFGHGSWGTPGSCNVYFSETTGGLLTKLIYRNDNLSDLLLRVDRNLMDNAWHSFALGATNAGLISIYIDGVRANQAHLAGDTYQPALDLYLGIRSDLSAARFLGGQLDDVRLYSRNLDAAEVAVLHRTTPGRLLAFGAGCSGSGGTPAATARGNPIVGQAVTIDARSAPVGQFGVLTLGASATTWSGQPLPLALAPFGAPTCTMWSSPDLSLTTSTSVFGTASVPVPLPNLTTLIGLTFYMQYWFADPPTNSLGLVVSNAIDAFVGGVR